MHGARVWDALIQLMRSSQRWRTQGCLRGTDGWRPWPDSGPVEMQIVSPPFLSSSLSPKAAVLVQVYEDMSPSVCWILSLDSSMSLGSLLGARGGHGGEEICRPALPLQVLVQGVSVPSSPSTDLFPLHDAWRRQSSCKTRANQMQNRGRELDPSIGTLRASCIALIPPRRSVREGDVGFNKIQRGSKRQDNIPKKSWPHCTQLAWAGDATHPRQDSPPRFGHR